MALSRRVVCHNERLRGSSVNDLGPSLRSRTGPAARGIIVLSLRNERSSMNLTLAVSGAKRDHGGAGRVWTSRWRRTCGAIGLSFEGTLRHPVRFREAMGALHDVVVSDLRYQPRDKTAYEAYKAEQRTSRGRDSPSGGVSDEERRFSRKLCRSCLRATSRTSTGAIASCARVTGGRGRSTRIT